ncbi:hypothetical protein C8J35_10880 [Rhizobium sp. PP-F2F-G38]|nr:hypothetical protein C8J37_1011009 [Rhizobium sp. PP-WC-1G-195]PYE95351.1 hypothetical protein C8J35_10880 [Rhizobium sp. PP-F2F-G38]
MHYNVSMFAVQDFVSDGPKLQLRFDADAPPRVFSPLVGEMAGKPERAFLPASPPSSAPTTPTERGAPC